MSKLSVTVSGDTVDEIVEALEDLLDELGGESDDDDDDVDDEPAPKKSKKSAPVEDDDDEDEEDDDDDDEVEDYTEKELKSKSIDELKEIAEDEFELDIDGLKTKGKLIEAILEAQDEEGDEDDDDDDADDEDDDDEESDGYTEDELNDMELDELKEIAKTEGIKVTPRMRKATLVKAIFEVAGVEDDDD